MLTKRSDEVVVTVRSDLQAQKIIEKHAGKAISYCVVEDLTDANAMDNVSI